MHCVIYDMTLITIFDVEVLDSQVFRVNFSIIAEIKSSKTTKIQLMSNLNSDITLYTTRRRRVMNASNCAV